jgi:hypothetical protein
MSLEDVAGRRAAAFWAWQGRLLAEVAAELDCGVHVPVPSDVVLVDLDDL